MCVRLCLCSYPFVALQYVVGDIRDPAAVDRAIATADCVWHNAAAVGPFHPTELVRFRFVFLFSCAVLARLRVCVFVA